VFHWSEDQRAGDPHWARLREVESREWWLWAFAVSVTLVLTVGILSLTFPNFHTPIDPFYFLSLREWVRGLAALVLLFDIYTIYQHLQLQRIRRRLSQSERLFQLITENAADMIAVVDRNGRRLYNSPAYQRVLGYGADELAATSSIEQVHTDDRARVLQAAEKALRTGYGERLEYRIRHKDGSWRVFESTANVIPALEGEIDGLVIVNRDITERKQSDALLMHRAFHDILTDLPNRALFLDRLQRAIAVARRHRDYKFAVFLIDIDEFKLFNDSLGHDAGDELLMQISRCLMACLRTVDTVSRQTEDGVIVFVPESTLARPGGDEFMVLVEELHDPSDAVRIADRILQRLASPFLINHHEVVVSASIGIVFSGNSGAEPQDMLRDAEVAMYRAKRGGKGRYEVFDVAMQVNALKRLQLETDLRRALELKQFCVHYQPLVSLQDGRIVGCEALSRWQKPDGLVMPGEFIAVADDIGVILGINRQLLREACLQLGEWHRLFPSPSPLTLSVNITAKQFAQSDLATQIGEILAETGIDPACIDLEITENICMANAEHSAIVLSELKALGVHLSIDDFGTGYSSLCRLQQFPVNTLKIDRAFISGMESDEETSEIVRIIISMAHNLGLSVVAEGIEHQRQVGMLRQMHCEWGQGYLFSRAVAAEEMSGLLARQRYPDPCPGQHPKRSETGSNKPDQPKAARKRAGQ